MRKELATAWTLYRQRLGGVVFTMGGAEFLMGQRKSDFALLTERETDSFKLIWCSVMRKIRNPWERGTHNFSEASKHAAFQLLQLLLTLLSFHCWYYHKHLHVYYYYQRFYYVIWISYLSPAAVADKVSVCRALDGCSQSLWCWGLAHVLPNS